MAARRSVSRLLIVALLIVATVVALVVFLTWGVSAGGSG
jgi:hypothetical protein